MALQWKNGATWEDIPAAALYSTWAGTYHIEYPPPQSVGIDGSRAAQTGKPRIVINAPWLTDAGFDFWRDLLFQRDGGNGGDENRSLGSAFGREGEIRRRHATAHL